MKISPFKVEQWMNEWEAKAVYNLGETCVDSLRIGELLELCGEDAPEYLRKLGGVRMSYGHIEGSPELRRGIASLYRDISPDGVIPTHGAIGANYQVIMTLIEPGDNIVCVKPTYQQHYSIPESIGAEVRPLRLTYAEKFLPNLDELSRLTDGNTKMITINNPNNPTGSWIPDEITKEIVKIAERAGAYVLSDEVYRGISEDGEYMTSIVDLYDKGVSIGSMSKVFSLAGLRLGWIATRDAGVKNACLGRRDYDTISCGVLDDMLSALALGHKDNILKRNKSIIDKNRAVLDKWVRETPETEYIRPAAGTTALVFYRKNIPSRELAERLLKEKGVLVTPGECFDMEGSMRIGYAYDSKRLQTGLDKIAELLREI
jgi:aspartate/methionine/tyrosine aminotransferase